MLKVSQVRLLGPPSGWFLCPYDMSSFLVTLSGTGRYLRAHLVFFHAPAVESLLQRSLVTFWVDDVFRNQKLGTRYANWYWGVVAMRPFQWTYLQTHIHIYPSLFLPLPLPLSV